MKYYITFRSEDTNGVLTNNRTYRIDGKKYEWFKKVLKSSIKKEK